ncbi:hypothetical protein CEXT_753871 [Caerostris extrusa]|uniref:G domain-containing protein n=1 Tax=Caerostris extrusa TaxID=172846 RepID=A0AAV4VLR1_CAEEX|nr:hypothetical protein CEXT_753871 [Caerostris extrusa]
MPHPSSPPDGIIIFVTASGYAHTVIISLQRILSSFRIAVVPSLIVYGYGNSQTSLSLHDDGSNSPNPKMYIKRRSPVNDDLISSTLDLLNKGKEIVFKDEFKDIILVLGNTGSGKSTFTQWLAGDNTKLISKEVKRRNWRIHYRR